MPGSRPGALAYPTRDEWIELPNTNPIFGRRTLLDYILRGGKPAMDVARRLLDARPGGR